MDNLEDPPNEDQPSTEERPRILFEVDRDMYQTLRERAIASGTPVAVIINEALRKYLFQN